MTIHWKVHYQGLCHAKGIRRTSKEDTTNGGAMIFFFKNKENYS
jgi:hypothetical protein